MRMEWDTRVSPTPTLTRPAWFFSAGAAARPRTEPRPSDRPKIDCEYTDDEGQKGSTTWLHGIFLQCDLGMPKGQLRPKSGMVDGRSDAPDGFQIRSQAVVSAIEVLGALHGLADVESREEEVDV